jgi:hypothetical protein
MEGPQCIQHIPLDSVALLIVYHLITGLRSIPLKLCFSDVITHGSKVVTHWCLLERILIEYSIVPPKDVQGNDQ